MRDVLGIFAKQPQPGAVKSRLAAAIGAEWAARLYEAFLRDLLERLLDLNSKRIIAYSPPSAGKYFRRLSGEAFKSEPQSAGDLGQRMLAFFERQFASGAKRVVLVGSDSPDLPLDRIDRAFRLLEDHELVVGPTDDGGYFLIGMSRMIPEIFLGIDWSTPEVFGQTVRRAEAFSVKMSVLEPWYDVDERKDLERLVANLAANRDSTPRTALPHTAAVLRSLDGLL